MRLSTMSNLLMTLVICGFAHSALADNVAKDQAIGDLQAIKTQNTELLQQIDARLKKMLVTAPQDMLSAPLDENQVEKLTAQRQELLLRQDFLDRLVLQVDTRFTAGNLREFLSDRLSELARIDLLSNNSNQQLWKQMTYLSQALRDLPERNQNTVSFIEGYLKTSSFKAPIKPDEYLKSRQYTNSRDAVAATPVAKDEVGEQVEKRIQGIESPAPQIDGPVSR